MTPAEMFAQLADVGGYLGRGRERVKEAAVETGPARRTPRTSTPPATPSGRFISAVEPDRVVVTS